jgi:hypothetical protein
MRLATSVHSPYEPSLRRWNAVSTEPEASRYQDHHGD